MDLKIEMWGKESYLRRKGSPIALALRPSLWACVHQVIRCTLLVLHADQPLKTNRIELRVCLCMCVRSIKAIEINAI